MKRIIVKFLVGSCFSLISFLAGAQFNAIEVKRENYRVATSAGYELVHIAVALCDTNLYSGSLNIYFSNVDTSTKYYKKVMHTFSRYKSHPFVQQLNTKLKANISNYVFALQQGYSTAIEPDTMYTLPIFQPGRKSIIRAMSFTDSALLQFAKDIGFFSFYKQHRLYFKDLVSWAEQNLQLARCKDWLETRFRNKYQWYDIAVSPLMGGMHFTSNFNLNGKETSMMWVSAFDSGYLKGNTPTQASGRYTGIVFTEIDHNYVNPLSNKYMSELNQLFGGQNRGKWIKEEGDAKMYATGYQVFNEYMTHAVFLLYIRDYFNDADAKKIEEARIKLMENRRKYYRFNDFYQNLLAKYQRLEADKKIDSLYPGILEWAAQ